MPDRLICTAHFEGIVLPEDGCLVIELHFQGLRSPAELGLATDMRRVGLGIGRLTVSWT